MKPEQKKKWEKKIAMAKKADNKSAAHSQEKTGDPDTNMIRKKFKEDKEDLPLEPDESVEDDIDVEVKSSKGKASADTDANDDSLLSKKVIIKSKSKGTLGFNG